MSVARLCRVLGALWCVGLGILLLGVAFGKGTLGFLWYDSWLGFFVDRKTRYMGTKTKRVYYYYICPLPCVVFKFPKGPKD